MEREKLTERRIHWSIQTMIATFILSLILLAFKHNLDYSGWALYPSFTWFIFSFYKMAVWDIRSDADEE